jgi:hypothetical protein
VRNRQGGLLPLWAGVSAVVGGGHILLSAMSVGLRFLVGRCIAFW